jgi:hypothetical protein
MIGLTDSGVNIAYGGRVLDIGGSGECTEPLLADLVKQLN